MQLKHTRSVDNRHLISAVFTREGPEASEPEIEAVFEFMFPEQFGLTEVNPGVLNLLSVTRSDTHVPVTMTDEETIEVAAAVSEYATSLVND